MIVGEAYEREGTGELKTFGEAGAIGLRNGVGRRLENKAEC